MITQNFWTAGAVLLAFTSAVAQVDYDIPFDDRDLFNFKTRPDLRAPKYDITTSAGATPGYIFVAPYEDLLSHPSTRLYQPHQLGPAIYDQNGDLIWSGVHLYPNRATFDFKLSTINGVPHPTFIVGEDPRRPTLAAGAGIVLDASFKPVYKTRNKVGRNVMNMHEYSTSEHGGRPTGLMATFESKLVDIGGPASEDERWVGNNGFVEIALETGEVVFEWWALDHVLVGDSLSPRPPGQGSVANVWDFFHLNSIDKDSAGDYIISARFFSCIYKISGKDGHIIWRLGGKNSSFALQDFNFSSQHDARLLHQDEKTTVLSFLDNAADGFGSTANSSSAMVVSLDMERMTATLVSEYARPDGHLSELRGNVQVLDSGNTFVGWSENGYITEFDTTGRIVQDGHFASHRFVTYRAFKFNMTATPAEDPVVMAWAYGPSEENSVHVLYSSWNGATEVARWNYFGGPDRIDGFVELGSTPRSGFETEFMVKGHSAWVYAEALAENGTVLGRTSPERTIFPKSWLGAGDSGQEGAVQDGLTQDETNQNWPGQDGSSQDGSGLTAMKHEDAEATEKEQSQEGGETPSDKVDEVIAHWSDPALHLPQSPLGMIVLTCLSMLGAIAVYSCCRRRSRRGFKPLEDLER